MFQYAAGKALASRHGCELKFDLSGFRAYPLRSFLLDRLQVPEAGLDRDEPSVSASDYFFRARRRARVDRLLAKIGFPRLRSSPNSYSEPYFHFDRVFDDLGSRTELFGYFQSERYFKSITESIRGYFQPREPLGEVSQTMANKIAGSAAPISIHVRRGDYEQSAIQATHGVLGENYYRKALSEMESRVGHSFDLFVFSDDLVSARQIFNFVSPSRVTLFQGDPQRPWEDMALMARCHHHVIANSSFSWWGAWLNPSQHKIVVAPKAWFTTEGSRTRDTRDLYPAGWIQV